MPVPFVACKNKVTGAVTDIPETALPHMTDWVPIDPERRQDDGAWSAPAEEDAPAQQPLSSPEPDAAEAGPSTAARTTKRKAESAAIPEEK